MDETEYFILTKGTIMKTYEKAVQKAAKTLDEFIEAIANECVSENAAEMVCKSIVGAEKVKTAALLMIVLIGVLYDKDPDQVGEDIASASATYCEGKEFRERMGVCCA